MKRIVVDASVARSAGDETASADVSKHCRDVLLAIREKAHAIVMTPLLEAEWARHQSRFTRRWRGQMYAQRLVEVAEDEPLHHVAVATMNAVSSEAKPIVSKDLMLLHAALKTDSRIVSLDTTTLGHLRPCCQAVQELRFVFWAVPSPVAIDWLSGGAADSHDFRICPLLGSAS